MRHTRPATLVGLALVALVGGFVVDAALVSSGQPSIVPSIVLGLVLLVIGGIVVTMALPVRRVAKGTQKVLAVPMPKAAGSESPALSLRFLTDDNTPFFSYYHD